MASPYGPPPWQTNQASQGAPPWKKDQQQPSWQEHSQPPWQNRAHDQQPPPPPPWQPAPPSYGEIQRYGDDYVHEERGRSPPPPPRIELPAKRKRPSKWGAENGPKAFIPGVPCILPGSVDPEVLYDLLMRIRIEETTTRITGGDIVLDHSEQRSPSPEPTYDSSGKRTNTREQRMKLRLIKERQILIEEAKQLNPMFKPPSDYRPINIKKMKKIFIPIKRFPDYNFIGLIIGPRGLTQKSMEKESGAKIAIRGKGSTKDGKGRSDGRQNAGEEDDLHVQITGDTEEQINKAAILVEKLLVPVEEGKNEHKRMQLRKLAEINGTLRDNIWEDERASRINREYRVQCAHCGEVSHITSDCPMKGNPEFVSKTDLEYTKFLEAIGEKPEKKEIDASYEEFMAAIGGNGPAKEPPKPIQQAPVAAIQQPPWAQHGNAPAPWMAPGMQQVPPPGAPMHFPGFIPPGYPHPPGY